MDKAYQKDLDREAAIRIRMQELHAAAEADGRDLTEDEQTEWDALEADLKGVQKSIGRKQRLRDIELEQVSRHDDAAARPDPPANQEREPATAIDRTPFKSFGEQVQAIVHASRPGAVADPRLLQIGAVTGMSEGTPSDGGFLVQTDFQTTVLQKIHQTGQVWNKCRKVTISSNSNKLRINAINETSRVAGSRLGGIRGYWVGEGVAKTASQPEFRQLDLDLKKLIGLCYATDELMADASALEGILMDGFAQEFGFKLDDAVINGLGAGTPLGIMASPALVTVPKETGQAAKTIVAKNIDRMFARLWAPSVANAVWFINQDCWPQIFDLHRTHGTGGSPMYMRPGEMNTAPNGLLMGRPIYPIEQCQTLGTKGDIILADLNEYIGAVKGGIETASSIHVKFVYDEIAIRWVYRADGQPIWASALTPFKGTNTQSPYVCLAVRA